jgi:hypothetical protein
MNNNADQKIITKLLWCRKSILDNHVILFQIFCLSCEYEIANKKPRFRMESVKKIRACIKKEIGQKNKTES